MRICHIVPSLEEQHGGPSRSVRQLAAALAGLGHDVDLLSTRPESAADPVQEGQLQVLEFRRDRPQFLCCSKGLREHLRQNAYDCIHHHALWLRTLHYAHQAAMAADRPLVISPRGMMTDWAWRHRRWKKQLASLLVHPDALARANAWHATSPAEADDIRRRGFRQRICVAPNGVERPTAEARADAYEAWSRLCPGTQSRPVALFYSRFHRKKRLIELIDLWREVAPRNWLLLVVGIPQEYTVDELTTYVRKHSSGDRITVVDGRDQPPPYSVASLFLLPSHSENFGMAIAEAMAWGLPVVVTDTTPWAEVSANEIGWCVPWEAYPTALHTALTEPADQLKQRGLQARDWVLPRYSWEQAASALVDLYDRLRRPAS